MPGQIAAAALLAGFCAWQGRISIPRAVLHLSADCWKPRICPTSSCPTVGPSLQVYKDQDAWTRRSILYTAGSGKFSSDRTIYEYAKDIWDVNPVPVPN